MLCVLYIIFATNYIHSNCLQTYKYIHIHVCIREDEESKYIEGTLIKSKDLLRTNELINVNSHHLTFSFFPLLGVNHGEKSISITISLSLHACIHTVCWERLASFPCLESHSGKSHARIT